MTLPVIVDSGASELRIGYAGETAPSHRVPPEHSTLPELFARAAPPARPPLVVALEKSGRNAKKRLQVVETLFEECDARAVYVLRAAAAAVYAVGRSSGGVFELSETSHEFCVVGDGFIDHAALLKGESSPAELHRQSGANLPVEAFRQMLQGEQSLQLPDGSQIDLSFYRQDAKELVRRALDAHSPAHPILLCGRGYLSKALAEPVLGQLSVLGAATQNSPDPQTWRDLPFLGASIVAGIPEMLDVSLTRAVYAEAGEAILNKLFN